MRLVQLPIPTEKQEAVVSLLEDEGLDYVITDESGDHGYSAVVYFPLPNPAVEHILDLLAEEGLEEDGYTVVLDAETVISEQFEELSEQYEEEDTEPQRISRQELEAEAKSLTPRLGIYVSMTVVSAVVATAGLLLNSPAVVVGSMVIAPLIGPALGASVGSVLNDQQLFRQSVKYQFIGILLAILSAAVFAWMVRVTNVVPPGLDIDTVDEIAERLTPDLLSLFVALGAGVAGVLSITTGMSVALVGVMIAAALIPPAAAAGIAIAWGEPAAALGATVLVFVNILSVNLAGLLTLWYAGYRPSDLFDIQPTQMRVRRQVIGLVAIAIVFSVFLGAITYGSFVAGTFEQSAEEEIEMILAEEPYEEYELLELRVLLDTDFPVQTPDRVIVTIGGPPGEPPPELANEIQVRVSALTDEEVVVEVRFIDTFR